MKSFSIMMLAASTVFVALVLGMHSAVANNLSFLKQTPMAAFTDEDHALMMQNVEAVLSDANTPAKRDWNNPKTGHSGTTETLVAFSGPKSESCKRLRVANKAGGRDSKATYTLCKGDAGWQLASSDYAPVPKGSGKAP
jgi:hypothetical protein